MTNFDWRTDEEQGWEQLPARRADPTAQGSSWAAALRLARRRWRPLLAMLCMLAAGVVISVRALALHVQATEETKRREVLAAHSVVVEAAANGDQELFLSMLGGDRSWRHAQRTAFDNGVVFGRSAMGLEWQEDAGPSTEVTLSPDLQQALVTTTVRYVGYTGAGGMQPIALQHFLRYEHDGRQWRLEPHETAVWDGWSTFGEAQDRVRTVFPRRDEAFGRRLTGDIAEMVDTFCNVALECPPGLDILIRFELNDESLHTPTIWTVMMRRDGYALTLPAPSQVGLPIDEASYQALRHAYLHKIVTLLFDRMADREYMWGSELWDALARQIFADLGLIVWPNTSSTATQVQEDILALCADGVGKGASLWRYDSELESWSVELQGRNFTRMVALDEAPGVLLRDQPPMDPLATQPPTGILWWGDGREMATFDYYLGDALPGSPTFVAGTPEGQNSWIYLGNATDCNGVNCSGVIARDEYTVWSPNGRHTLFQRPLEGSRSPPAGDDVLWMGDSNGVALQRLGEGSLPFWIDDETFGYLTAEAERQETFPFRYGLVIHRLEGERLSEPVVRTLPIAEALRQQTPSDEALQEMGVHVSAVAVHPAHPQTLYMVAVRFSGQPFAESSPLYTIFLIAVDVESGEISPRIATLHRQWSHAMRFSPDGRWLSYVAYDQLLGRGVLSVHDLAQEPPNGNVWERVFRDEIAGFRTPYGVSPVYDWSARDGKFLTLEGGVLTIVDFGTQREQQIVPPTLSCAYAAWAD